MYSLRKIIIILLSIPKSIWFNIRHFPLKVGYKLPIFVRVGTKIHINNGKIIINAPIHTAMIRLGFHEVPVCNSNDRTQLIIDNGTLCFEGTAHLGHGTKINVTENGKLTLGDNFAISASSQINCYHSITMGKDIQFSWDCLVMDSDTHTILDENLSPINDPAPIVINNKVWVGCRVTILKGSTIPSHCVVGACSLVTSNNLSDHTIIAGSPAKSIKKIGDWHL